MRTGNEAVELSVQLKASLAETDAPSVAEFLPLGVCQMDSVECLGELLFGLREVELGFVPSHEQLGSQIVAFEMERGRKRTIAGFA